MLINWSEFQNLLVWLKDSILLINFLLFISTFAHLQRKFHSLPIIHLYLKYYNFSSKASSFNFRYESNWWWVPLRLLVQILKFISIKVALYHAYSILTNFLWKSPHPIWSVWRHLHRRIKQKLVRTQHLLASENILT